MQIRFRDHALKRLDSEPGFSAGLSQGLVRAFRKTTQRIHAAADERDLRTNATRFEKLSGARRHQYSMRLNDQYRLIIELEGQSPKIVVIVAIEDYHA